MLFDKGTYAARRKTLMQQVKSGLILLFGNNDSPMNYPGNVYKYRQDSAFPNEFLCTAQSRRSYLQR